MGGLQGEFSGFAVALHQGERVEATFEQTPPFSHQFRSENEAAGDPVAAGVLLGFSHRHEGLRRRVFDHQIGHDTSTVVGHRGFTVGFVEHLVQTVWSKGPTDQVPKGHGRTDEFLRDGHTARDVGRRTNDDDGGATAAFLSVHRAPV